VLEANDEEVSGHAPQADGFFLHLYGAGALAMGFAAQIALPSHGGPPRTKAGGAKRGCLIAFKLKKPEFARRAIMKVSAGADAAAGDLANEFQAA
jgi:hypothetical protein